jgi:hypothetical protein
MPFTSMHPNIYFHTNLIKHDLLTIRLRGLSGRAVKVVDFLLMKYYVDFRWVSAARSHQP